MKKRICLCFYGITRNTAKTYPYIQKNIIEELREDYDLKTFCHFFELKELNNPTSGEIGVKIKNDWDIFNAYKLKTEKPDLFLEKTSFEKIKKYGDPFGDEFKSLKNFLHEIYSLKQVFNLAKRYSPSIYIFTRPDLIYWDSFKRAISYQEKNEGNIISIPYWQSHYGLNDRFAICNSDYSASVFANRIDLIESFCTKNKEGLHSEKLVE